MDIKQAQNVLSIAKIYAGKIDGDIGPLTIAAVKKSEEGQKVDKRWKDERRLIASAQREMLKLGHNPGPIDGISGAKTDAAYALTLSDHEKKVNKTDLNSGVNATHTKNESAKTPAKVNTTDLVLPKFVVPRRPIDGEVEKVFGKPGDQNKRNTAGKVTFPFPFKYNGKDVKSFNCHELVAPVFQSMFNAAVNHYGEEKYNKLRLDIWGGCYNPRKMRGGAGWSMHAWGVAVDLDPANNQLKWGKDRALFARPEYEDFWKIVEAHKLVSLGRARNYDWMHIQCVREVL